MSDIFIARQPIFDAAQQVIGYEILHRASAVNAFPGTDADAASSTSVDRTVLSVGLEPLAEGRLVFINVSRRLLLEELYTLLPAPRTVLELLETVAPDREIVEACFRLKSQGYRLALDDYAGDPALHELLPIADFIKIDLQHPDAERTYGLCVPHRQRGAHVIAEKVENAEMHAAAAAAGCDLFQGYFFCRPEMIQTKDISAAKLNLIRFLAEACREDASFERLEEIFRQEMSLATRLLRYLRSAGFGWNRDIASLDHALRLVGIGQLRKWAAMTGVVSIGADRPPELVTTALARARFSEQLGRILGPIGSDVDLFLTGLLSLMDAMVGRPLKEVLANMALPDTVRDALLGADSPLAGVLGVVTAYERGEWDDVQRFVRSEKVDVPGLRDAYTSSLHWAHQAMAC